MRTPLLHVGLALVLSSACDGEPEHRAPAVAAPPAPAVPRVEAVSRFLVPPPTVVVSATASGLVVDGEAPVDWDGAAELIWTLYERGREREVNEATPFDPRIELVADAGIEMGKLSTLVMLASNAGFEEATLVVETDQARTRLALALANRCKPLALDSGEESCETIATFHSSHGTYQHAVTGAAAYCTPMVASGVLGRGPASISTISTPDGRCVARSPAMSCPYVFAGAGPDRTWGDFAPELAAIAVRLDQRSSVRRQAIVLTRKAIGSLGCGTPVEDVESVSEQLRDASDRVLNLPRTR